MTCTCGGTMSGNWAIGSAVSAIRPASVMTIEMTSDRRGRSMKVEDSTVDALSQPQTDYGGLVTESARAWIPIFQCVAKAAHARVRLIEFGMLRA